MLKFICLAVRTQTNPGKKEMLKKIVASCKLYYMRLNLSVQIYLIHSIVKFYLTIQLPSNEQYWNLYKMHMQFLLLQSLNVINMVDGFVVERKDKNMLENSQIVYFQFRIYSFWKSIVLLSPTRCSNYWACDLCVSRELCSFLHSPSDSFDNHRNCVVRICVHNLPRAYLWFSTNPSSHFSNSTMSNNI